MCTLGAEPFRTESTAQTAESAFARHPNVLFIVVDDLRPAIGAFGDPLAKTRNLDHLAETSAIFQNAYCQQAFCHASRVSFLAGVRPETTGIYDLNTPLRKQLPNVVTLPQLFRQNGYHVVGCGKIFHSPQLDDPQSWDSAPSDGPSTRGLIYALPENKEPGTAMEEGSKSRGPATERADVADNAYIDGFLADTQSRI